jgi:hypothetical protein
MRIFVQNEGATGEVGDGLRGFLNHEGHEENVATEDTESTESSIIFRHGFKRIESDKFFRVKWDVCCENINNFFRRTKK